MKKWTFLVLGMILSATICEAQQSRVYSQFFMNPFIYNPAYAGVEGHSVFFGMYRKQWSNIDGAPALSHVSFHTPLKGGLGIGVTAYNDQEGLINTSAIKGSLSYLLAIDRKHYLRVGMSLGGGTKSINTDGFDSPADPAFANLSESASFTLADFGATYHFGHFNVGFALPNLVGYEIVGTEDFSRVKVDPLEEALFKANYRGHISDDFAFEPHLLYRYNQNLPNQFEAALIAHLKHIVWVGASYRQDAGIIALFGTKVKEKIGIGFAYDIGNSRFNELLGPTFEIHIGYHLGTKKDHAEHVSSFIKSHRKSLEERERAEREKQLAEQQAREADKKDKLAALRESRNERLNKDKEEDAVDSLQEKTTVDSIEKDDPRTTTTDTPEKTDKTIVKDPETKEPEKTEEKDSRTEAQKQAQATADLIEKQRQEAKEAEELTNKKEAEVDGLQKETGKTTETNTQQEEVKTDGSDIVPDKTTTVTTDERTIDELILSEEPKVVKKGNHLLELQNGNYVVAGAFQVFDRAEDFSDRLFNNGYRDVIVGYISETKLYYVVVFQSQDLEKAKQKRSALQQRKGLSKIWLLTVQ